MKKILTILLIGFLSFGLMACGSKQEVNEKTSETNKPKQEQVQKEQVKKEPTQEELNNKIKKEAVKGDFVKINGGEMDRKSVFIEGKVSNLQTDQVMPIFMLTSKEGDGFGVYNVQTIDLSYVKDIKDGDKVKVYGKVVDRKTTDVPTVFGNVIGKLK